MIDDKLQRHEIPASGLHRVCWVDLATTNQAAAKSFYGALFDWGVTDRKVREGQFALFGRGGTDFASLYQLTRKQTADGVPSHWTPYVAVPDRRPRPRRLRALAVRSWCRRRTWRASRASA
jgi:predicted enzyme related to lactoylglutathione lyase